MRTATVLWRLVVLPVLLLGPATADDCIPDVATSGPGSSITVRIETWKSYFNQQMSQPTDPEMLSSIEYQVPAGQLVKGDGAQMRYSGASLCLADPTFQERKSGTTSSCYKSCLQPGQNTRITISVVDSGDIVPGSDPPCCLETNYRYHYIYVVDPHPTTTTPPPSLTCFNDATHATDVTQWKTASCGPGERCFLISAQSEASDPFSYVTGCESTMRYWDTDVPHKAGAGASCRDPEGSSWKNGCLTDSLIYYGSDDSDAYTYHRWCVACCASGDKCNNPFAPPPQPGNHGGGGGGGGGPGLRVALITTGSLLGVAGVAAAGWWLWKGRRARVLEQTGSGDRLRPTQPL